MTRDSILILFRFIVLVLLQSLLLNNVNFSGYINPYVYLLFVFLYPIEFKRTNILLLSFLLGLSIDFFSNSGGINASATLLIAYVRLPLLKILYKSKDIDYQTFKLNEQTFGQIISYTGILTFIHHLAVYALDYFTLKEIGTVFSKAIYTTLFTLSINTVIIYLTKGKGTKF